MSLWTIVPVRGLAAGKSRLAGLLDSGQRYELNLMLLERALDAVAGMQGGLACCIVASAGEDALAVAHRRGAIALGEPRDSGLNAALERARAHARAAGASAIMVLAADLPVVSGAALSSLIGAVSPGEAAIVADKHGRGTNGLLLPADSQLRFAFGEDSLARHAAALRLGGAEPLIWEDPALSFDLDTPADHAEWQAGLYRARAGRPAALPVS
jgi:2-phospho-L-lactate guanylyltransferase